MSTLTRDEAIAAGEIVDNLLGQACGCTVTKSGEGRVLPFESSMVELLLSEWGNTSKAATETAVRGLMAREGIISNLEVQNILAGIEKQFQKQFTINVGKNLGGLFSDSYKLAKKKLYNKYDLDLAFGIIDVDAISWLTDNDMYWIGNYYSKHLSGSIAETVASGLENGLGRVEVGNKIKEYFQDYPGAKHKPETYWRGLAANAMNRSRNFGLVAGYEEIGEEILVVSAIIDKRTSPICRRMNGKEIPTSAMVSQRNKLMAAKDPEDVKTITPWLSSSKIKGKTTKQLIGMGIGMPPYHFHCRSTVIAKSLLKSFNYDINKAIQYLEAA